MNKWKYPKEKLENTLLDGRWEQEVFRTLYTQVLHVITKLRNDGAEGTMELLVTPKVSVVLVSLPQFIYHGPNGDTLGYFEVADRQLVVRRDLYASIDFIVVSVGKDVDIIQVEF